MKYLIAVFLSFSLSSCIGQSNEKGVITARESIVMAVASDLRTYSHYRSNSNSPLLNEIYGSAVELYKAGIVQTSGDAWLLQPGAWKNHSDYRYSGHERLPSSALCSSNTQSGSVCELAAKPTEGIGMDVSHFLAKWPIFLTSFKEASYDFPENKAFFSKKLVGLESQLFNEVITASDEPNQPPYLFTNYMDGTNGIYRWNYNNRGKDWGYKPFQLSSTPCYSSLILLNSARLQEMYADISNSLPYSPESVEFIGNSQCNQDSVKLLANLSSKINYNYPAVSQLDLISSEDNQLFRETIQRQILRPNSWVDGEAYKGVVGQRQAVLHVAFVTKKIDWIEVFDQHFRLFLDSVEKEGWKSTSEYNRQHYMLFVSRYLALSAIHQHQQDFHSELYQYLYGEVEAAWTVNRRKPVSNFRAGEPILRNYGDWVNWKIQELHRNSRNSA